MKHAEDRIDNNVDERAIRPLAIGRKNGLFFGSVDGGEAGAIILSLVQTCRNLGINPEEYLEDIFGRLMSQSAQRLHELLPDEWKKARTEENTSATAAEKKRRKVQKSKPLQMTGPQMRRGSLRLKPKVRVRL